MNRTFDRYQELSARTMPKDKSKEELIFHSVMGMGSEIGELQGLYQKTIQGHEFDEEHAKKEVGDILWFMTEYCTTMGWKLGDIAEANNKKLLARYPDGFEEGRSLHRKEGDI